MEQFISTAISTVVGGILAIAGSIMTTAWTHKANTKRDLRKKYEEKIEELYILLTEIKSWFDFEVADYMKYFYFYTEEIHEIDLTKKEPSQKRIYDMNRILMISVLYEPSFKNDLQKIKQAVNTLEDLPWSLFDEGKITGGKIDYEAKEDVLEIEKLFQTSYDNIVLLIEKNRNLPKAKGRLLRLS